jgi:hypothetical protein
VTVTPDETTTPADEIAASDPMPGGEAVAPPSEALLTAPIEAPPSPPDAAPGAQETAAPMPDEDPARGVACRNCGAQLSGPFCHECGQSRDDLHRSLPRLTLEVAASFIDFDSRIWRTVTRLFFAPADLTRDYLAGERASQTPPLRMFLVAVVMVFLSAAFANAGQEMNYRVVRPEGPGLRFDIGETPPPKATPVAPPAAEPAATNDPLMLNELPQPRDAFGRWLMPSMRRALASPDAFVAALINWAQKLAILLLPIGALTMGAMFAFSRRFLMFDHLIFTMHGLAAQGALLSLVLVLGRIAPAAGWLILFAPVHTFAHMRGTYGLGVFGTLVRMLGLLIGTSIGFLLLAFALFLITVYDLGGR